MGLLKLEDVQIRGLVTKLSGRCGRMHYRRKDSWGHGTHVTANIDKSKNATLFGRVTAARGRHAGYKISLIKGLVQIDVDLEDPTGTYSLLNAIADIEYCLRKMIKAPVDTDFSAGRDTSRLKGFYLKSTGNKKVGKKGLNTLRVAVNEKEISQLFLDHCVAEGFTMEHY